jgi:hypothetical protein
MAERKIMFERTASAEDVDVFQVMRKIKGEKALASGADLEVSVPDLGERFPGGAALDEALEEFAGREILGVSWSIDGGLSVRVGARRTAPCPKCGSPVEEGYQYCPVCGKKQGA